MSRERYRMRLLVMRLSALGDVAILEPVVRARAAANRDVLFLLAAPPLLQPLFQGIDNVQYIPTEKRQSPRTLYRQLVAYRPDMVADMHHVNRVIAADWLFCSRGLPVHTIHKHGRLAKTSWQRYDDVFSRCGLDGGVVEGDYWKMKKSDGSPRIIGVAPFAQHQGKVWPLERMERLVGMLSARGYRVRLFGSGAESRILEGWAGKYTGVESVAGKYPFARELQMIAQLDLMISMDSANMHFASCQGVPVVSIWGATHPCRGFYGWRQDPSWAVQIDMDCRPCSKYGNKPCKYGNYPCMQSIGAEEVLSRVETICAEADDREQV